MKILDNEDGIALVTALMFTLICLAMIMTLMYYVLQGTKMSAAQKRYRTSLEASYGGVEVVTKAIIPRLFANTSSVFLTSKAAILTDLGGSSKLSLEFTQTNDIIRKKLNNATDNWGIVGTSGSRHSVNPKIMPDFVFTMKGTTAGSDFKVYSKIVDTVPGVGLIDTSGIDYLDPGMSVSGTSSSTQTPRTPNVYTIEVQGEAAVNPREKAGLSVLYAY
jgi:hypothetical protein